MFYKYRIKAINELHPLLNLAPCYVAQFACKLFPFIWFDIKPRGLGSNYGNNKKGAEIYIAHHSTHPRRMINYADR